MFSFKKLNNHYENKDHLDAKEYIEEFMCPLTNGEHAIFEEGKVTIVPDITMKNFYLNRFPDDIKKWYCKTLIPKKLICDIKKSQIGKNHINAAPELTRERKEYKTFSEKTRDGVDKMLNFFKEVWCNDNDKQYNYLLQWFSNTLQGNKIKLSYTPKPLKALVNQPSLTSLSNTCWAKSSTPRETKNALYHHSI